MNRYFIGVEIGGTKLQVAIGTPDGDILHLSQGMVKVEDGAKGIRSWITEHLPPIIRSANQMNGEVVAIGCGFGGPIETQNGRIIISVHIKGWTDFELKGWFEDRFNLPAIIANDTNAASWGEYCNGIGKGSRHFFYTNMGSGIGGGIVIDGALHDGQGYGAGEFGQTFVPDWTTSIPGQAKKVEDLCSGWSIESRLRTKNYVPPGSLLLELAGRDPNNINCQMLADAARAGDEFALAEIDNIAKSMGIALANLLCLINPEVIAIGGGVSNMGDVLLDPIRKYTREHEFISSHKRYTISRCKLGTSIVLIGAILLANQSIGSGS